METKTKLLMTYVTDGNKKVSFSLDDPRTDLTEEDIYDVMELILGSDVFLPKGEKLAAMVGAKIVNTDTTEYDLVF